MRFEPPERSTLRMAFDIASGSATERHHSKRSSGTMTIRRSRRKTTGDDDPPPRPANKFILFRLAKCKEMEQASEALCGGTLQQRHLSVDLGEAWNALPVDEKNRKRMHSCRSISVGTRITSPLQTGRSAGGGLEQSPAVGGICEGNDEEEEEEAAAVPALQCALIPGTTIPPPLPPLLLECLWIPLGMSERCQYRTCCPSPPQWASRRRLALHPRGCQRLNCSSTGVLREPIARSNRPAVREQRDGARRLDRWKARRGLFRYRCLAIIPNGTPAPSPSVASPAPLRRHATGVAADARLQPSVDARSFPAPVDSQNVIFYGQQASTAIDASDLFGPESFVASLSWPMYPTSKVMPSVCAPPMDSYVQTLATLRESLPVSAGYNPLGSTGNAQWEQSTSGGAYPSWFIVELEGDVAVIWTEGRHTALEELVD